MVLSVAFLLVVLSVSLMRPHWGVALFAALLPLEAVLPLNLGGASTLLRSPVAVIGGMVAIGALLGMLTSGRLRPNEVLGDPVRLIAPLFIFWIFATHPVDAWSSADRSWVLTFLQLWVLSIVAGAALDSEDKHGLVMTAFGVACVLSAYVASVTGIIADDRGMGLRVDGLGNGANASARQFAVGMVFMLYFRSRATSTWLRVLTTIAAGYLMVGVVFTQSRAGLILGGLALILVPLMGMKGRTGRVLLNLSAVGLVVLLLVPQGTFDAVPLWFVPERVNVNAQAESLDANIRYSLWQAGFEMWRDNPLSGVGIGRFQDALASYLPGAPILSVGNLSSHSMFVGLLSQTGTVGLALFVALLWTSARRAWWAHQRHRGLSPPTVWWIVIVLLAIGGTVKDDATEKLLWLALGVAAAYGPLVSPQLSRRSALTSAVASGATSGRPRQHDAGMPVATGHVRSTGRFRSRESR